MPGCRRIDFPDGLHRHQAQCAFALAEISRLPPSPAASDGERLPTFIGGGTEGAEEVEDEKAVRKAAKRKKVRREVAGAASAGKLLLRAVYPVVLLWEMVLKFLGDHLVKRMTKLVTRTTKLITTTAHLCNLLGDSVYELIIGACTLFGEAVEAFQVMSFFSSL